MTITEFVNDDPALIHEAAMVRLAAGKSIDDVIAWGHGDYALLCFVPDGIGMPHLGVGMVVPFTIEG